MNTEFEPRDAPFVVGGTYFLVGFFDDELVIPAITTLIYLGLDAVAGADARHCFQDASSHASPPVPDAEPTFFTFDRDSNSTVVDRAGLIRWLQSDVPGRRWKKH